MRLNANPAFNELFNNLYYPEKRITKEFLKNYSELSLAVHFMDDGCKLKSGYSIATNCFSNEDLKLFIDFLKSKFNLDCSLHKNNILYIGAKSKDNFTNLIKPYIIDSMLYKLHTVS